MSSTKIIANHNKLGTLSHKSNYLFKAINNQGRGNWLRSCLKQSSDWEMNNFCLKTVPGLKATPSPQY